MPEGNTHEKSCLLLAYQFPPIGGIAVQRPLKFARYLGNHGWHVTVLTTKDVQLATMDESLLREIPREVDIVRLPDVVAKWMRRAMKSTSGAGSASSESGAAGSSASAQDRTGAPHKTSLVQSLKQSVRNSLKTLKSILFLPDEMVFWAFKAAFRTRDLVRERNIDCIYTTSGPASTHLAGLLAHWMTGVKWIVDFRDPWTDNFHFSHGKARTAIERWLEGQVFLNATSVITVTDSFKELFDAKYPQYAHKIRVIRNGVDPSDFPEIPEAEESETNAASKPFTFFYAGILYPDRTPTVFFEALRALIVQGKIREEDVKAEFAGVFDYPGHDDNHRMVERLGLQNVVSVLGYQPRVEVLRRMKTTDALLLVGDRSPSAGQYVPGKVYEYLFSQKPILALLPEGEAALLVKRAPNSVVSHSFEVEEVAGAIQGLMENRHQKVSHESGDGNVLQYTRQRQTRELAELMNSLLTSDVSLRRLTPQKGATR